MTKTCVSLAVISLCLVALAACGDGDPNALNPRGADPATSSSRRAADAASTGTDAGSSGTASTDASDSRSPGGSDDRATGRGADDSTAPDGGSTAAPSGNSAGPATPGDDGLSALDGTVRIANFYVDGSGAGAKVDAYWGLDARPERRIATVGYGRISESVPARGTTQIGEDGSPPQLTISFFPTGRRASTERITVAHVDYDGPFQAIVELSWGRSYTTPTPDGLRPAATQVIRIDQVGTLAGADAVVIVNNLGTMAIGDGTPLQVGPVTGCNSWTRISDDFENGNGGESTFVAPAGSVNVSAFTAACKPASTPQRIEFAAGDRAIVFVYGTAAANRRLLVFKLDR